MSILVLVMSKIVGWFFFDILSFSFSKEDILIGEVIGVEALAV